MTSGRWDDPATSGPPGSAPAPLAPPDHDDHDDDVDRHDRDARRGASDPLELGRGGHAVVVRGADRHLPRDVAWKVATGAVGRATLAHEAGILASLEHPAIVPVYDLVDDGVTLRLALRIVRGRTLHDLLAPAGKAAPEAARLALIRHVLAATEAVAWAHGQGVVHRDLKPGNIMIGELGETQVIDWGLALRRDEDGATAPGEVVGTPQTMSPEQARGERVDPRSDVWSLGATLAHVIAGRPLMGDGPAADVLAAVGRGERPSLRALAPRAPRELVAIAERALAALPEERYPDAGAMAADLLAWLDGRRVSAHDYGALELAVRFVRRFRLVLAVAVVGVVALAVVLVGDYLRVRDERDRARAAEAEAKAAVRERERVVTASSLAEARRELAVGARPEAIAAAWRAEGDAPSPEARGVLAALGRGADVARVSAWALAGCVDTAFAPDGRRALCGARDDLALWQDGARRWSRPGSNRGAVFVGGGAEVIVQRLGFGLERLDGATGASKTDLGVPCGGRLQAGEAGAFALDSRGPCLAVVGLDDAVVLAPCGPQYVAAAAVDRDGRWAALCRSGPLVVGRGREVLSRAETQLGVDDGRWLTLGFAASDAVVAGSTIGELARVTLDGAVTAHRTLDPATVVRAVERALDAEWLLVQRDGAAPELVDATSLATLGRLPRAGGGLAAPVVGCRVVAADGPSAVVWSIAPGAPELLDGVGGVTALATDGATLVIAHDSAAELRDVATGRVVAVERWSHGTAKAASYAADGSIDVAVAVRAVDGGPSSPFRLVANGRRLGRLADGRLVRATTDREVGVVGEASFLRGPLVIDLAVADQLAAVLVDDAFRGVRAFALGGAPVEVAACPIASGTALALGPGVGLARAFVAQAEGVVAWDLERCAIERVYPVAAADLARVAVSRSGSWVAAGTRLGGLVVWRADGELRAQLDAHPQIVTALTIAPDERWLASGAWDGRVRLVALDLLDRLP